jgi:hypothetical protein
MKTKKSGRRTIKVPSRKQPLTVVINRKKWFRGYGSEKSRLLQPRKEGGKMCCLGFDAIALGFTRQDILGEQSPADVAEGVPGLSSLGYNTLTCESMMTVNDSQGMSDAEREATLIKLAKRIGRRFVFKN